MFYCYLAAEADNFPTRTERVKEMIKAYVETASDKTVTEDSLHEVWQGFTCRNISTPQFWLVTEDSNEIGFMVTQVVEQAGVGGIEITQGYLKQQYAKLPNLSRLCLSKVEQLAGQSNFKFVMCCTSLNADIYERWIGKAGYKRQYTVFAKEV